MLKPLDVAADLALARDAARIPADFSEENEALSFRRRIAALVTTVGFFGALAASSWSGWNVFVLVLSFGAITLGPWLWAERPAWLFRIVRTIRDFQTR